MNRFALTLVVIAFAACSGGQSAPQKSAPASSPTPPPQSVTLRVSVFDYTEQRKLRPNQKTEVWVRDAGSWFPEMRFGGDTREYSGYKIDTTQTLHFYPLGREVPEIKIPVSITSDLCPAGCDRDIVRLEIYDDRFESWGGGIEKRITVKR